MPDWQIPSEHKDFPRTGHLDPSRLQYYGYAFLGDVIAHQEMVKSLREYTNTIALFSDQEVLRGRVLEEEPGTHNREVRKAFYQAEGERLQLLHQLGFQIVWSLPMTAAIDANNQDLFREQVQFLKEHLPEMELVEMVYFYDEPDINSQATPEILEAMIDIFKETFSEIRTTICYAIAQPGFLEVRIPENLDVPGIDPYLTIGEYEHTASDFRRFYGERLALSLEWVRRWDKPYIIAGDAFRSQGEPGKRMPTAETTLWYYQLALLDPLCEGLVWLLAGDPIESENLEGISSLDENTKVIQVHREIGNCILGPPPQLGLPGKIGPPAGR